jgi:lipopolysaccharide/colanic/teichoic acid biosynthesis glycosyltransferase
MSAPATQDIWTKPEKLGPVLLESEPVYVGACASNDLLMFDWYAPANTPEKNQQVNPATAQILKRLVDMLGALFALLLALPIMSIVALVILIDSRGPIFYRTYRVGRKGRLFRFYKFRTMVVAAESRIEEVRDLNEREKILFKITEDPRLTRIGGFLRKYSLDELPQLWNILKGDMSLVGPRPPIASEYEQFRPEYRRRTFVPPGLTGLWQVTARTDPSFERYVEIDCEYVDHWSLWLDLKILCKTIPAVLLGTGQ